MKRLFILFLGILIFTGCQKKNSVEIIPDYNSIYFTSNNIDKPPQLIEGDEKRLETDIQKEMERNSQDKISLEYRFLLGENGKVEKILPVITPGQEYSNLVAEEVSGWKFAPGKNNNEAVKSQYTWYYNVPGRDKYR